ncbi:hypothetical protein [Mycobacterium lepromatosis]|uniref:hypothetical protein n=1 Tax=Mycobacterium lepromatosis TaxID=480418 RepID=UPI000A6C5715
MGLPGGVGGRQIDGTEGEGGSVTVRLAASVHAKTSIIGRYAEVCAYNRQGAVVGQMAVRRSVGATGPPRGLAAAGVPVAVPFTSGPLSAEPAARALLTVLSAMAVELDGEQTLALPTGPIGRVDPVSLRQLC